MLIKSIFTFQNSDINLILNISQMKSSNRSRNILFFVLIKGQILFDDGDPRQRLYILTKGLVRLERYDESATYYYYDYVNTNNLFPMSGMFGEETYTYTAQAMTDIETFYLPVSYYEKLARKIPNS